MTSAVSIAPSARVWVDIFRVFAMTITSLLLLLCGMQRNHGWMGGLCKVTRSVPCGNCRKRHGFSRTVLDMRALHGVVFH